MPKPWRHPKYGTYYLKKRVPTDIKHLWTESDPVQVALGTKDSHAAQRQVCIEWLKLEDRFNQLRRRAEGQIDLHRDLFRNLLDEWAHGRLKEDDDWRFDGTIPATNANAWYGYSALIDELIEGAVTGRQPAFLTREAAGFLTQKGINFDKNSIVFTRFLESLSSKYIELFQALSKRDEGLMVSTPAPPKPSPASLSEAIADFIACRSKKKVAARKKDEACMAKFLEIVGNKPVPDLKQRDIRDFFDVVQRLPSQRGGPKRPEGMSLRAWAGDDVTMAPDTFKNNYAAPIRHFLTWAKASYQDDGFPLGLTVEAITYQGTRERGEDKQRPFTPSELQRLFLGDEMRSFAADPDQAGRYWLPMLGLHTGARINELCQINPAEDWITPEGIHCLHITTETDAGEDVTKSIKTGTPRIVPIHPVLIELGFLDYLQKIKNTGAGRLFPEFKPKMGRAGERAREWFSSFVDASGLRDNTPFAKLTGFHAFRHTLITYAANHRDPSMEAAIDQITGHVGQGTKTKRGYIGTRSIKKAHRTVKKIDFGLEFIAPTRPSQAD